MYQNYNYYPQQQPQTQQIPQQQQYYQTSAYLRQAPPQIGLKGRLVASLEEARATSIDFDGSVFYFPDLANKRIYTKQINIDGTASLYVYELREMPVQKEDSGFVPSVEKFVTREEFERVLQQLALLQKPTEPAVSASTKEKVEILSF